MAALVLHLLGIDGGFLCDDFGHLDVIARNSDRGTLGAWVVARFFHGLDNGNFAYRPIVFASYALDWVVYGADATGWHATNLALYFANALVAGLLVRRWLRSDPSVATQGGLIAAAAMVAFPFAGEISFWPVGRFDLLAALFSLLYLHALPPASRTTPAHHALRVLWLLCALLSKESAMPLPFVAWLVCALAVPGIERRIGARLRFAARETASTWIAFALYLLWRKHLFGSYWKVYPDSSPPHAVADLIDRVWAVRYVVSGSVGGRAVVWTVAALACVVALAAALVLHRGRLGATAAPGIALLACAALYAVAPAFGFTMSVPTGEGARLLYLAWVYSALALAILSARHAGSQWAVAALLVAMLYSEAHSLGQWQAAGREMRRITDHISAFAERVPANGYALLLLPDHVGPVPFARNAQGAIVSRPTQPADYLDRMAVITDRDFEWWSEHLYDIASTRFAGSSRTDLAETTALYCWNPVSASIVRLPGGAIARDPAQWRRQAAERAGAAGCLTGS
jgi:hypothetical protein